MPQEIEIKPPEIATDTIKLISYKNLRLWLCWVGFVVWFGLCLPTVDLGFLRFTHRCNTLVSILKVLLVYRTAMVVLR